MRHCGRLPLTLGQRMPRARRVRTELAQHLPGALNAARGFGGMVGPHQTNSARAADRATASVSSAAGTAGRNPAPR